MFRSALTATLIAIAIQIFTVGLLAPKLPREVLPPGVVSVRNYSYSSVPVLYLQNTDGAVRINTSETVNGILIEAGIRAYPTTATELPLAEEYVESLIQIAETDNMLHILSEPEERPDPLDLRINYSITTSPGIDLAIEIDNGNVWVSEGCNQVTIEGNNTDVEVQSPEGRTSVKTINGRINVLDCREETFLETVNGSIMTSMSGGSLQASTVTGSITATLLSQEISACDLTSLNGTITLVMSERLSADVHASTEQGVVRADTSLVPVRSVERRREIHGTLGKGDTKISVNSMNGDVTLQRSVT